MTGNMRGVEQSVQRLLTEEERIYFRYSIAKNGKVKTIRLFGCACGNEQRGPKGGVCGVCGRAIPDEKADKMTDKETMPLITRLTSVSCGTAEHPRGDLLGIKDILKWLDDLTYNDDRDVMLEKIEAMKEFLK